MNKGARAQVRNGILMPKNGGNTYEALAREAYLTDPKRETVERERLKRSTAETVPSASGPISAFATLMSARSAVKWLQSRRDTCYTEGTK